MEPIYQEIRDFCVAEYNRGHDVGWNTLKYHLQDCGYDVSSKTNRGLGQMVSATYRRLDADDTIGRNALLGYWPEECD